MIDEPRKTELLMAGLKKRCPSKRTLHRTLHANWPSKRRIYPFPTDPMSLTLFIAVNWRYCLLPRYRWPRREKYACRLNNAPTFNRNAPLSREIETYQRHRIKKLKQQQGSGYH